MGDVEYTNFDEGRTARQKVGFEIGGEKFTVHEPHPDEVFALLDEEQGDKWADLYAYYKRFCRVFVRPEDHERWDALADRREDPLTYGDVEALSIWLQSRNKLRPTLPSAPSAGTGGTGTPTSRGGRSPKQVVVPGSA